MGRVEDQSFLTERVRKSQFLYPISPWAKASISLRDHFSEAVFTPEEEFARLYHPSTSNLLISE